MAKRLKKTYLSSLIVALLAIELFSLLPQKPKAEVSTIPFFVSGLFHLHPPHARGVESLPWLANIASKTDLDFIVLVPREGTPLEAKRVLKTDFFIEEEVTGPAGNLLVFHSQGRHAKLGKKDLSRLVWEAFEGRASVEGFFSAIAHPSHVKTPWNRFDRFTEGIEVLSFDSQWVRELYDAPLSFMGSIFAFPFNQYLASLKFLHPYQKDLMSWDNMNELSPGHFGILSHGLDFNLKLIEGSAFHEALVEKSFRIGRNIVFLKEAPAEDFTARRLQIYNSIREGRLAIALTGVYPFQGNDWFLDCDGRLFRSGDRTTLKKNCHFQIKSPASFPFEKQFKLYRDGELINQFASQDSFFEVPVDERGVYRLEVWAKTRTLFRLMLSNDTPYVLYNPIYLD